jgi:GNAT superfamily N-acetyltransferase
MPQLTDTGEIRARLETDRLWSAFSLADLDEPFAQHATWFGPPDSRSLLLVYGAFDPPIVFLHGDAAECDALLAEPAVVARTARAHLNVRADLMPLVTHHFRAFARCPMTRMVLRDEGPCLPPAGSDVVRLGPAELPRVQRLYAEEPPAFFLPAQLEHGVYFGVPEGDSLIAVAGTHVLSKVARVGAIGNVYTRPDRRRRGLAGAVAGSVALALREMGISTVVLNVADSNPGARAVYERLGFTNYCSFYEGQARR